MSSEFELIGQEVKWEGQIVRAGVEAFDGRLLTRTGRQHNDRKVMISRLCPDGAQQAETVEIGHHHVGDEQVRNVG